MPIDQLTTESLQTYRPEGSLSESGAPTRTRSWRNSPISAPGGRMSLGLLSYSQEEET